MLKDIQKSPWDATYDPFGKATVTTASVTNNLRFPGQYYDAETGLHYNWHRYYWPEVGRYVSTAKFTFGPDDIRLLLGYDWNSFIKSNFNLSILINPFFKINYQTLPKETIKIILIFLGNFNPKFKHLYAYVINNPIINDDKIGEQGVAGAIAGGIVGTTAGLAACICGRFPCAISKQTLALCAATGAAAGAGLGFTGSYHNLAGLFDGTSAICLARVFVKIYQQIQ